MIVLPLLIGVLLWVGAIGTPARAQGAGAGFSTPFAEARFVESSLLQPPAELDEAPFRALPDRWGLTGPQRPSTGWYRIEWDAASAGRGQTIEVLLESVHFQAQVFLNGTAITAPFDDGRGLRSRVIMPLRAVLPEPLIQAGVNRIDVRVWSDGRFWTLGPIVVGTSDALVGRYVSLRVTAVDGPLFSTALTLGLSVFVVALWFRQADSGIYVWFGLAGLAWVARNLLHISPFVPSSLSLWRLDLLMASSNLLVIAPLSVFILRSTGQAAPWVERTAIGLALFALGWSWLAPDALVESFAARNLVIVLAFTLGCASAVMLARRTQHVSWQVRSATLAVLTLSLLFAVHDIAFQTPLASYTLGFLLLPYASLLFSTLVAGLLVGRFKRLMRQTQAHNVMLSEQVEARTQELERTHRDLERLGAEQAKADERARLMRELHDGVGAQLAVVSRMLDHPDSDSALVRASVQDALDTLRLTVDAAQADSHDLLSALGDLRYALTPRLSKLGIELRWQVDVERDALPAPAQLTLDCLRIVQELVANVVKHANASCLSIRLALDSQGELLSLTAQDNGIGPLADNARVGNGLRHIRERAQRHGGSVELLRHGGSGMAVTATLRVPGTA